MKKKLFLIPFCIVLAGCLSLDKQSNVVTDLVNPRQAEVSIQLIDIAMPAMTGCSRYTYADSGYGVQFVSQICDTDLGHYQLYPVTEGYAIKTDTGISDPVIRFFRKDIVSDITLDISNTLNENLTGDAFLGCLVSLSPLQKARQQEVWRYSVVPFGTYEETVKDIQKTDTNYRGCGMFDGSQEPYGYFQYHSWSSMYFFVQLATTGTLFDPNSFAITQ